MIVFRESIPRLISLSHIFLLYLILLPVIFTIAESQSSESIRLCSKRLLVPHQSIQSYFSPPKNILLPVRLRYKCYRTNFKPATSSAPLLVLLQGSLGRPRDYSVLSNRLVLAGFFVVIPDYARRNITTLLGFPSEAIAQRRAAGFDCPRFGQFGSLKALQRYSIYSSPSPS